MNFTNFIGATPEDRLILFFVVVGMVFILPSIVLGYSAGQNKDSISQNELRDACIFPAYSLPFFLGLMFFIGMCAVIFKFVGSTIGIELDQKDFWLELLVVTVSGIGVCLSPTLFYLGGCFLGIKLTK